MAGEMSLVAEKLQIAEQPQTSRARRASAPLNIAQMAAVYWQVGEASIFALYSVSTMVLLKKFTVSVNLSLSGTQEFLNSSFLQKLALKAYSTMKETRIGTRDQIIRFLGQSGVVIRQPERRSQKSR